MVIHRGRAADILRAVIETLEDAKDLPNGAIVIDFGNKQVHAELHKHYPKIVLPPQK